MSKDRLGARSDFDEWASTVVTTVKKHRQRFGPSSEAAQGRRILDPRRWASRVRAKIAD